MMPRQLAALLLDPRRSRSYWPDEPRKSRPRIFVDLLWWLLRHGEVNGYYYVYGLDRKDCPRARELLAYRAFRRIRNRANLRSGEAPWNYVCVLRDKLLFASMASTLGVATPRPYALLDADGVTWLDPRDGSPARSSNPSTADRLGRRQPLESLCALDTPVLDGFCKQLTGIQGEGAFALHIDRGRLRLGATPVTLAQLRARLQGRYLLQERIEQHPRMSSLHASSLNTLRLITFCRDGRASLFCAALRIGTGGNGVDNWASGGLICAIDTQRAELRGEGYFKPGYGGRTARHPDSGIQLAGFSIPGFSDAVELVIRLHEHLREIHSVGWDVGISTEGPVIIEGNDDWEGGIPMVLEPDFRRRFLRMYDKKMQISHIPELLDAY